MSNSFIPEDIVMRLTQLSCEDVAEKLNMNVQRHKTLCFMHDDYHPSLSFLRNDRTSWFCFVCNKGGNAIELVREYTGCSFVEACLWLCEKFGISVGSSVPKAKELKSYTRDKIIKHYEAKPFAQDVAQFLINSYGLTKKAETFLYKDRHLSPQVISDLRICSIDDGFDAIQKLIRRFDEQTLVNSGLVTQVNGKSYFRLFTPCLLFPYYNKKQDLIGLQSRYLGENPDAPRFQFISSQKTRLYNIPILNSLKNNEELYISEGITDCIALLSSGKKAVAIPSATIFPEYDLNILTKFKLFMVPDGDEAGRRAFNKLQCFFINRFCSLKEVKLPEGIKDFSEYYRIHYGDQS